jgi:HD domain
MSASGPTQGDYSRTTEWKRRPWAARGVALLIRGGPIVLATVAGLLAARLLPSPHGWTWLLWLAGIIAISQLTLIGSERAVHQLTPLASLLRFSLVFPDEAPQRFSRAMRSGSVQKMRREMESTAKHGLPADVQEAANTAIRMVGSLNHHDRGTRGHSERVRAYTDLLAEEMGLAKDFRDRLRWGAILHDMGKLTVPAAILNKPGRPTEEEWEILKAHPAEGGRILAPLADWLGDAVNAASQHHERWDGKGYPLGLAAEEISLSARIVAVADAFAVMTAARAYKKPLPLAVAREELTKGAGTQFDPDVVRAMLTVSLGKTTRLGGIVASFANAPLIGSMLATTAPAAVPAVMSSSAAAMVLTASLISPTGSQWIFEQPTPNASTTMVSELAFADQGIEPDLGAAEISVVVTTRRPATTVVRPINAVSSGDTSDPNEGSDNVTSFDAVADTGGAQLNPTGVVSITSTAGPLTTVSGVNTPPVLPNVPSPSTLASPTNNGVTIAPTQPPTPRPTTTRPLTTRPSITTNATSIATSIATTIAPSETKPVKADPPVTATTSTSVVTTPPVTTAPPDTKPPTTSPPAETTPTTDPRGTKLPPLATTSTSTTVVPSPPTFASTTISKPILTLPPVDDTLPAIG